MRFVILVELVTALLIAGVLVTLLMLGLRRRPFGGALVAVLALLFLGTWAGGIWLAPIGPTMAGVHVLSFLAAGLLMALVLAAATPPGRPRTRGEALRMADARDAARSTLDLVFWLVIALLAIAILVGYVR
jgi:hypothetical protein